MSEMQAKTRQYICFKLNGQEFGADLAGVIEVLPMPEITPVVHTPPFIKGVINLRGQIIAVIDLKVLFLLPVGEGPEKSNIVIVQSDDKTAGFIVDSITKIHACGAPDKDSIPATITGKLAEYLEGVARMDNRPFMIIDLNSLFGSDEFRQFE